MNPLKNCFNLNHALLSIVGVLGVILAFGISQGQAAQTSDKPNILLIMSDDVGFSDIGCFGGEAATPNLDKLAANGLRFTQFYNTARCCPTRAALLTGLYPHQTGIGHMNWADGGHDGYRGNLNNRCVTLAEVLRTAGYRTYMSGKWHLTRFAEVDSDQSQWPVQRGFEKFYGTLKGSGSFYDPIALCRQNRFITPEDDPEYKPEQFYYTDAISDNAVRFLQQHEKESPGKPFFMYVAYTAAHWPMHALEKDIAKYKGRFDAGYDALRQARMKRLLDLGLISPDWTLSPTAGDWDTMSRKPWQLRCMEVFAAMLDNMDQGIGRIVDELKRSGRFENTVILYLQDNGGCAEDNGRRPQKNPLPTDLKPMAPDELQNFARPRQTRDGRPVRSGPGVMPGPADTFVAYGQEWANVSNTPFREYKHWVHEGGISTPLIVHWPKGIPVARRGKLETAPGHLVDMMPTFVDLAGATYPSERQGQPIKPMQGVSLLPALAGKELQRNQPLFWEHEGNRAVRHSRWKLVAKEDAPWELYDLTVDRTEMHDLATKHPEIARKMASEWDAWAARSDVLPLGAYKNRSAK